MAAFLLGFELALQGFFQARLLQVLVQLLQQLAAGLALNAAQGLDGHLSNARQGIHRGAGGDPLQDFGFIAPLQQPQGGDHNFGS